MNDRTTLLRPPPADPNKSPIENVLDVTELAVLGPVSRRRRLLSSLWPLTRDRAER